MTVAGHTKTDWVGEVFAAQRDCGEDVSIVYGRKSATLSQAEPQWFELPHDRFDGIGGLAALLREQGLRVGALPALRGERFGIFRALRGLAAVLPTLGIRPRTWRTFDGGRDARRLPVAERLAWRLLSVAQTKRIVAAAKRAGVTVNTYLLFHLDAQVCGALAAPKSPRRWMIPVNLRGAVTRHSEAIPHMSFLAVDVGDDASPGGLQAELTRLKRRAYHWGSWLALNAGRLLGRAGMRRDMRNRERRNHGWTGIFSNLGVWEVAGSDPWIFCPAISRVHPVGAGCITMNGRMALALQLHDALRANLRTSHALLDAWQHACVQEHEHHAEDFALGANA